ncbi:SIMPL domain-containing protein [Pasteurella oralis]|uniref:SIMPL domain-containing protein n=1 Tax=Pasteurella oralis TaxID=1071947 RepID=A0ABW4NQW4_9PAST
MKLKHLTLALLALPFAVSANAESQPSNIVTFSAEVEREVNQDLMQVVMFTQEEGKDISLLNKNVTERINTAIALVKKQSIVQIQSQDRNTQVRYGKDGKQNGWVSRAELVLQSKDSVALSKLVSELNNQLMIEKLYASISPDTLTALENEMTEAVLQKFEQKAKVIQTSLKSKGYKVIELNIATPDHFVQSPRPYSNKMMRASAVSYAADEMALEAGKTQIRAQVQAKIELIND